jgi:dUTP pyrophosphatase
MSSPGDPARAGENNAVDERDRRSQRAVEVLIKRLRPAAVEPSYKSANAAGLDLAACCDEPFTLGPGESSLIPTGWAIEIPEGYEGQVRPRSGLATRHHVTLPNTPGTIDADYRGELAVPLLNLGRGPFTVEPGMRIAQLVIAPIARARIAVAESLSATARGSRGFGSTGTA